MSTHFAPLVSIITPSLNQGRFIEQALQSVLKQEYPHVEHLVIDGGSNDETVDTLRRYAAQWGDRLVWLSEPDRGPTEAINKGIQRARGGIIGWLNADDYFVPGAIQRAVAAFELSPNAAVVYGRARHVGVNGEDLGPYPIRAPFDWEALAEECYISQPAAFIRREPLEAVGLLDERFMSCMDYELWIRLGRQYPLQFIDADMARTRMYPAARTFSVRREHLSAAIRIVKEHYGYVPLTWCYTYAEFLCHGRDQFFAPPIIDRGVKALGRLLFFLHNLARPEYILATLRQRIAARRQART